MNTDQTIAQMLQALQNLATEYAPAALQTALTLKRIDGAQSLALGFALLIAGLFLLPRARKVVLTPEQVKQVAELEAKPLRFMSEDSQLKALKGEVDWMSTPVLMIRAMFAVMCFVGVVTLLFDVWNWAAVFNPTLALAHDVLLKVSR